MKILRIFPRRTKATPDDEDVVINREPYLYDFADFIKISVTFSYDLPIAERLQHQWKYVAPSKIGGPATGERGGEFIPGMFLKKGYVITSRGCPNRCWFCDVWRREGPVRELPICDGWNVLDDNLLACSEKHIHSVFDMLERQGQRIQFTGGLEAKRLKQWHVERLRTVRPKQIFFAYDTPDDYEPLIEAGKLLHSSGFTQQSHALRCYVLCGFPGDSFEKAEERLKKTIHAGFTPMAMLYRDKVGRREAEWKKFQKNWARPAIIYTTISK